MALYIYRARRKDIETYTRTFSLFKVLLLSDCTVPYRRHSGSEECAGLSAASLPGRPAWSDQTRAPGEKAIKMNSPVMCGGETGVGLLYLYMVLNARSITAGWRMPWYIGTGRRFTAAR